MQKAEDALRDAQGELDGRSPEGVLGLAQCAEAMGQSYGVIGQNEEKSRACYTKANEWYRKAANIKPDASGIKRRLVEFLVRTRQLQDAETQLTAILKNGGSVPKDAEVTGWARRMLAHVLLLSNNEQQNRKALALVEPWIQAAQKPGVVDPKEKKPEDLRILARVYEAQKTPEYHKKARRILEELVVGGTVAAEDRFLLALLYVADGEWDKAHEQYRLLLDQTQNTRELEVQIHRPDYIAQFVNDLLKHYQSAREQRDLAEAQELIEQLKAITPSNLGVVVLEARVYKARNQIDKVIELIKDHAGRPNLPPLTLQVLAKIAEEAQRLDLSEQLLQQLVKQADQAQNRFIMALFLSRHGRVEDALGVCESLWQGATNPEAFVQETLTVLFKSPGKRDQSQIDRVTQWLERGLARKPNSAILLIGLASLYDYQGRYSRAEALYRQAIDQGGENVEIPLNNLAFLVALQNSTLDGALDLVNRAISRRGPAAELLDTRGFVYTKLGDSRHAIEDLKQACRLDPSGPKYFHLTQAYLLASNRQAAIDAFTKAHAQGLAPENLHALEVSAYQDALRTLKGTTK
jgi:tetratricopeptide (TPR) repeat protein